MRRELKGQWPKGIIRKMTSVTRHIPMRRELKEDVAHNQEVVRVGRHKAYPDEKGTERAGLAPPTSDRRSGSQGISR